MGSDVRVFDGAGREWAATVSGIGRSGVEVALDREVAVVAEPPVAVTLGLAVLKNDAMDVAVRDATMLGVAAIVPMLTEHVAVAKSRGLRAVEHWRGVAIASAKQCGRAVVPRIESEMALAALLDRAYDRRLALIEPAAGTADARTDARLSNLSAAAGPAPKSALMLVGPEGGWSKSEIDLCRERGVIAVRLGPRTLRADSVPAVALSALWTVWGW